jgi:hypothetical protein
MKSHENFADLLRAHYAKKFGESVTPIAMLKSLAVISSSFTENVKLWIIHQAPSRHLKSQTSLEQARIFPSSKIVYAGSDFTIHGMAREFDNGKKLNNRCFSINDMTLLLASKAERTSHRLIDGLSELCSEGKYHYNDFGKDLDIRARFSFIANITPRSYWMNHDDLLANTFLDRCLIVFNKVTDEEMSEANVNRKRRNALRAPKFKSAIHEADVQVTRKDLVRLNEVAKRWRSMGGYSSISQTFDVVKSIAVAHAILSDSRKIGVGQFLFLDVLEPYVNTSEAAVREKISELQGHA